jgi:ABC-type uncharacterized transport system auxiliary subunit
MKRIKFFTFAAIIALCGGCSIFPDIQKTKVNYFEIGFDSEDKAEPKINYKININRIETEGPYNQRMVFRTSEHSIEFDEYNRWSQSPSMMLRNYLKMAFNNPDANIPEKRQFTLNANILRFDSDIQNKKANLILEVDIKRNSDDKTVLHEIFVENISVKENKAVFYVEGMKKAISNIVKKIKEKMSSIK